MTTAPFDLSTDLGVSGRLDAPELLDAVTHAERVIAEALPRYIASEVVLMFLLSRGGHGEDERWIENRKTYENKELIGIVLIVCFPRGLHESSDRRRGTVGKAGVA